MINLLHHKVLTPEFCNVKQPIYDVEFTEIRNPPPRGNSFLHKTFVIIFKILRYVLSIPYYIITWFIGKNIILINKFIDYLLRLIAFWLVIVFLYQSYMLQSFANGFIATIILFFTYLGTFLLILWQVFLILIKYLWNLIIN